MRIRVVALFSCMLLGLLGLFGQLPDRSVSPDPHSAEARLPNGKLQRDEILKAEYDKSLQDATELIRLSEDLKGELEKNTAFVVSVSSIKKTEEIEKLAKRIRGRMKRG